MESYSHLARLYDGFMNDVDYPAWASYVSRLYLRACGDDKTSSSPNARILECGCGTGNITIPLARMGYDVIAADLSSEMLAVASEKARAAGLRIPFVQMDMRKLASHRRVDCVLACCDCVNYLTADEDAMEFFRSAFEVLKSGGVLLFDISTQYKLENVLGNNSFTDSSADSVYFWQNIYDERSKLTEMKLEFFKKAEPASGSKAETELYERSSETHIQRAYSKDELIALLEKACFADIEVFDAFTLDPPAHDSERIQFIAVKKAL